MDPSDMHHMTAGALVTICLDGKTVGFQMGVCSGYIAGVMNGVNETIIRAKDGAYRITVDKHVDVAAMRITFLTWMSAHRDELDNDAGTIILRSLIESGRARATLVSTLEK
jgi:hypothetical protein